MNAPISGRLKLVFLVHAIIGFLIGLGMLFFPVTVFSWFSINVEGMVFERLLGIAILSFGLSSALAYFQNRFESVKLLVQLEIIWTLLATILLIWAALSLEDYPALYSGYELGTARLWVWADAILMGLFFVGFGGCYLFDEKSETAQTYAGSEA